VGASVLIILAVIILPMLLSGRSDTRKQESSQISLPPKPDELSIETRRFPIGTPNQPAPGTGGEVTAAAGDGPAGQPLASEAEGIAAGNENQDTAMQTAPDNGIQPGDVKTPQPNKPAGVDSETRAPAELANKLPAVTSITLKSGPDKNVDMSSAANASPGAPRYLVQVASFSSDKRANELVSRLKTDNLPVLMDVVDRPSGRLHRVRVGPYRQRTEADKVISRLSAEIKGLAPRLLDLRPSESAPVSTPSDPLVRWVVQVGSFSGPDNAEALVAELRLSGMAAFSEKVSSSDGIIYKVRIGPEIDRDKATELARRVKTELDLDGFVTTQE
jgi:DedD protein